MATATHTKDNCLSLDRLREGPPTVSIETAAQYLGVSRGFAYRMVKSGHLPVIRLSGTRMRVPAAKLLRLLEGESDATAGA
ncbi:helix-turn-helix domain-containing protein [Mycolicibacterium obuense]|uniref:DNA-binding protein n=1 Tax=Mycolicibacterium obuense TaxID=1807 RepID=A0A0M2JY74_9MYCO|nr:helix-turn-helix domain-containing protein [Mycolicibacterium obuense]KKF01588.1 DNA-binding protein [Mycolicibacterium obuense]TDL08427.1 helix-turn-helix domain-containing protein [Mycolicibacterium obuense]